VLLFEILGDESHPNYQAMQAQNNARLHSFLMSAIDTALAVDKPFLSQTLIKSFNFHAITALHINAGEYRVCKVKVGNHIPPEYYRVAALMDDFTNTVNRHWDANDAITLAAYVLWRLNHIHPFINGNGRAARAATYFVLCLKLKGPLLGTITLPELLVRDRNTHLVPALESIDASFNNGNLSLSPLVALLERLIDEQVTSS
jgi:prophage maintenance system killer protein